MLDLKFLRENKEKIKEVIKNKNSDVDIELFFDLDEKRRDLLTKVEELRAEQKKADKEKGKELKEQIITINEVLKPIQQEWSSIYERIPNTYSEQTPIGKDEKENVITEKIGEVKNFDFEIKDHIQLGKDLDLIDIENGVKVSGFRGYFIKNDLVLLEQALLWHSLLKLKNKGYSLMSPPTLIREFTLKGSGHFPFGSENIYQTANPHNLKDENKEELYLAGTSESALLAYYSDSILNLPIKLAGISPCYRSEAGSYGKDTKGLYRMHEFKKVEQVIICTKEQAEDLYKELEDNSREILDELKLPYQIKEICTGDMGAPKYRMRDIETWMPSRNDYGETHSCSHLSDWQARRLSIKYKDKEGNKLFAYTLNNTMVASPRILISILEYYQQKDGSIKIPEILVKYLGFDTIS